MEVRVVPFIQPVDGDLLMEIRRLFKPVYEAELRHHLNHITTNS